MTDYARALKRPFTDIKTLVIGIILSMIPIVNFVAVGYSVKIAQATLKKNYKLIDWTTDGIIDMFVKGIIVLVMGLVYSIPAIAVFFLGAGSLIAGAFTGDPTILLSGLAGMSIFIIIGFVLLLAMVFLLPNALIGYAKSDDIGAFFDFSTIFAKSFRGAYVVPWLVMIVISAVCGVVIGWIPFIGPGIIGFVLGVANYTVWAEAYME